MGHLYVIGLEVNVVIIPPAQGVIPLSALCDRTSQVASVILYLKPEFLEELSESCETEEA